ncbi:AAA-like domain-containing protein [Capilliphycus salinus ALCB114379]|uniref:AAA-like domain-containing protein n=1 Tax=Capilliphycus salinus TaxID=2768948 RepID=UPI0039A46F51
MNDRSNNRILLKEYITSLSDDEQKWFEVLAQYLIQRGWTTDLPVSQFLKILEGNQLHFSDENKPRHFLNNLEKQGLIEIQRGKGRRPNRVTLKYYTYRGPSLEGCVPLDSPLYVKRSADSLCERYLDQSMKPEKTAAFLKIKAAKHTGKTSLLIRLQNHAKNKGWSVGYVDLESSKFSGHKEIFDNIDRFLDRFTEIVSQAYQLEISSRSSLLDKLSSGERCTRYLEQQVFKPIKKPKLLLIDGIDQIYGKEVQDDFLWLLRTWFEEKMKNLYGQTVEWPSLVIAYSTEPYSQHNFRESPLQNVGTSIELDDFTADHLLGLSEIYGLEWCEGVENANKLMNLLAGHPYLVNLALYDMATHNININDFHTQATFLPYKPFNNHLQRYLEILNESPNLQGSLIKIIRGETADFDRLNLEKLAKLGLIKFELGQPKIRCELYKIYFENNLGV